MIVRLATILLVTATATADFAAAQIRAEPDRPAQRRRDANRRDQAVTFYGGAAPYDLATKGTGGTLGVRLELPSGRRFVIEPGLGYFRYPTPVDVTISYLLPEVSFQYDPSRGAVRPYLGAGAGLAEFASGPGGSRGTVHAVAGLRLQSAGRVGARFEARIRSIDPLGASGRVAEITAGLRLRLGNR